METLENSFGTFESLLVSRYGLKRNCEAPVIPNGEAKCPDEILPGKTCTLLCDPGYSAIPGKAQTRCKEDGFWSVQMQCEVSLLLVSGGSTSGSTGDITSELVSFFPSKGCDFTMPDMPTPRTMHNIVYVPGYPEKVLACNGMTKDVLASCDATPGLLTPILIKEEVLVTLPVTMNTLHPMTASLAQIGRKGDMQLRPCR